MSKEFSYLIKIIKCLKFKYTSQENNFIYISRIFINFSKISGTSYCLISQRAFGAWVLGVFGSVRLGFWFRFASFGVLSFRFVSSRSVSPGVLMLRLLLLGFLQWTMCWAGGGKEQGCATRWGERRWGEATALALGLATNFFVTVAHILATTRCPRKQAHRQWGADRRGFLGLGDLFIMGISFLYKYIHMYILYCYIGYNVKCIGYNDNVKNKRLWLQDWNTVSVSSIFY